MSNNLQKSSQVRKKLPLLTAKLTWGREYNKLDSSSALAAGVKQTAIYSLAQGEWYAVIQMKPLTEFDLLGLNTLLLLPSPSARHYQNVGESSSRPLLLKKIKRKKDKFIS